MTAKALSPPPDIQRRRIANRILSSLPPDAYDQILPDLKLVPLKFRISVHEPGDKMPYVYFPNTGVISMLTVLEDGTAVEIATIGNEGMADLFMFLGLEESDSRLLIQVPGTAMRMESARFRELIEQIPALRALLGYYAVALFALVAQSAACNRMHPMVERCARWLLMTHDRVDAPVFPMTHDFLSEMLGVTRPSVSVAAAALKDAGYITYHRGKVTVIDRAGLEAASCECYRLIRERFDRLPGRSDTDARGRRLLASGEHASA
ncbi:MAG TPA: Crp/Fnr family transcriptional regulator [Dehalococcoidia bacterium]|nr:Crp/Fnr family transcriptional regulator [Dehalococcoidia bacterium]